MTTTQTVSPDGAAVSPNYRFYVLVMLTIVYTFNFIDRQIIGILSPAIKADLGLADWQLGILKGFAFAVLYTTLGIPIARLADKTSRVNIISIALAMWSGFTVISGACQNFTQLALARVGVGIGEAGGSPPSHSLISDYYPKEKRAGALAFFAMGIPIGISLAYLGGGWIMENFSWRMAFVVVGAPGLIAAIIVKLTIKEPPRGAMEDATALAAQKTEIPKMDAPQSGFERGLKSILSIAPEKWRATLFGELATVWRAAVHLMSIPTYRAAVFGATAISFSTYANGTWIVDFYTRSHPEFSLLTVLFVLGIISGTTYVAGTFLGGFLVDKLAAKNMRNYGYIPAIALVLNAPVFLIVIWHPSALVSLIFQAPAHLLVGFYLGPSFALAQTLAPVQFRALSTAIFFFILNMIALGLGPTVTGVLSSALAPSMGEAQALQVALTMVSTSGLLAAFWYFQTGKRVAGDWKKATGEHAA